MFFQYVFSEKLAEIQRKRCLVLVYFCTLHSTVFEKINMFSVNTNLGQVSMIANDMFFQKNKQCFNGKNAWF